MKMLYYIRHGESKAQTEGIMAGSGFDPDLSRNGEEQVLRAAKTLKGLEIDVIICSTMVRARQTAEIVAKELGYDSEKILSNKIFEERSYGPYEAKSFPDFLKAVQANNNLEGIESSSDLYVRAQKGIKWLQDLQASRILLVGHGAIGRMTKTVLEKKTPAQFHDVAKIDNAEILKFVIRE